MNPRGPMRAMLLSTSLAIPSVGQCLLAFSSAFALYPGRVSFPLGVQPNVTQSKFCLCKLDELKSCSDQIFKPTQYRNDFQRSWMCLQGKKCYVSKYMFEGSGGGKSREQHFNNSAVNLYVPHLLLHFGVVGSRTDATKHTWLAHVARFVDYMQREDAFAYTEVCSMDRQSPSTCQKLGFHLPLAFKNSWQRKTAGGAVAQLFAAERVGSHSIQLVRYVDIMLFGLTMAMRFGALTWKEKEIATGDSYLGTRDLLPMVTSSMSTGSSNERSRAMW